MHRYEPEIVKFPIDLDISSTHYLIIAHAVISDFFSYLGKPRFESIFYERCCNDNPHLFLSDIGHRYNITRERVRQIEFLTSSTIKKLFMGGSAKKPRCCCVDGVQDKIYKSITAPMTHGLIPKAKLIEEAIVNLPEDKHIYTRYLNLLLDAFGFEIQKIVGEEFYAEKSLKINVADLPREIESCIEKNGAPLSISKIASCTGKTENLLAFVLEKMSWMEKLDDETYQVSFNSLKNKGDKAYRLLLEHGKPMHFRDIEKGICYSEEMMHNSSLLSQDDRFEPIGRTGVWALKEWSINKDSVIKLIKRCLRFIGRPATYKEIHSFTKVIRPEIAYTKITTYISIYSKEFKWTTPDTIALKCWKNIEGEPCPAPTKKRRVLDQELFRNRVIEAIGNRRLTAKELSDIISPQYPDIVSKFLILKLYSCPVLYRTLIDGLTYFNLSPRHNEFTKKKPPIQERIENSATDILSARGKMDLRSIVEELANKGFRAVTLYKHISNSKKFKLIEVPGRRKKLIELNKECKNS